MEDPGSLECLNQQLAKPSSSFRVRQVTNITVVLPLGEQISLSLPDSPLELIDSVIGKNILSDVAFKDPKGKECNGGFTAILRA